MICEIILVALVILLYVFILQPLIPLIRLKIQYGNQAKLSFYPILGDHMYNKKSLNKYNDEIQYRKEHIKENKDLKFILTNLFNKVFIIILDPTYYKEVYVNHSNFIKYDLIGHNQLFDQGLLFSVGDIWQLQRNMLGPSFNYDKLKDRFPMMNEIITQICKCTETSNLHKLTSKITGQIVLKSFFGELADNPKLVGLTDRFTQVLVEAVRLRNKNLLVFLKISILKQRSWSFPILKREKDLLSNIQQIRKIVEDTVDEGIEKYNNKKEIQDQGFLDVMISHYLQNNSKVTKEMIIQQFITLVFAGTHTTSTAVAFCLYFLSKYPNIQDELLIEIQEVIGFTDICNNHLNKLVKLDAFIKESIRLKSPTPQPVRRYVRSDITIKDLRLKKNWIVTPSFEVQVTNEKYIKNPTEFNYKRWLDGNVFKQDNGFLYIPFSAGGRNCIGQHMAMMEMKLILIHFLLSFKIVSNEKYLQFPMHFTYTILPGDFARLVRRV